MLDFYIPESAVTVDGILYVKGNSKNMVKLLKAEFDIFALRKTGVNGWTTKATNANPVSAFKQKYQA